jgi:HAD superfamily hydrolase (TIGR01509 family)
MRERIEEATRRLAPPVESLTAGCLAAWPPGSGVAMGAGRVAAILDVDGTLVDSNYQHALAWYRAFRELEIVLPVWRLHRHVGMGGDKLVAAVAGMEVEDRFGDRLRERWEALFDRLLPEVAPLEGSRELIRDLKRREVTVVLASSAIERHLVAFVEKLGVRELVDAWTTKDDVEGSKPEPDLVQAALAKAEADEAFMVGDTPWDCEAARRAGIACVCVKTGGFSDSELREAGAAEVFESMHELLEALDGPALAGSMG